MGGRVDPLLERRERPVAVGHDPRRGALEDVHPADLGLDARDELDRRGAGADHGDALAGEVVVVVPLGGVEHPPLEPIKAGDGGDRRLVQRAGSGHEDLGGDGVVRGLDPPALPFVVPIGRLDLLAETDVRHDAVADGALAQVVPDLVAQREGARPVRVRGERERVQVRGHVALHARIGVLPPGAAHVVGLLEHDEVVDALLPEPDRHAEAGKAGADDRDALVLVHVRRSLLNQIQHSVRTVTQAPVPDAGASRPILLA